MAGTGRTAKLAQVLWEAEDSFADTADDTISDSILILDESLDMSGLRRPMIPREGARQYINAGDFDIPGPYGVGTFSFSTHLFGHGATAAGALTETNLCTLLGHALGHSLSADVGGAVNVTWSDANSGNADGGIALVDNSLIRIGAKGDGFADGQVLAAAGLSGATITLLTNAAGVPQDNDVIYAMQMAFPATALGNTAPTSDASTENNTLRFVLLSGNEQYVVRGCVCTGIEISGLNAGEIPTIRWTWSGVLWDQIDITFPDTTAADDKHAAPVAGGSFFYQTYGTATRNTDTVREFSLNIGIGWEPILGTEGSDTHQSVVGWRRVPAPTTLSFAVEAQDATTAPTYGEGGYYITDPNSQVFKHILYTCSVVDGRAIAFYFPRCKPIGAVPSQEVIGGINYVRPEFMALTNTANTGSELELAAFTIGMG